MSYLKITVSDTKLIIISFYDNQLHATRHALVQSDWFTCSSCQKTL